MQQEALGQRGGPAWLAGWKGAAGGDNGAALTEAEMQAAIDRAVAEIVEVRTAAIRADPTQAPPEAERTADLVYTLLAQCRERAGAASVRRMPPPRRARGRVTTWRSSMPRPPTERRCEPASCS